MWYCQTTSHDTRHAGKTMSTLLWLLLLLQVLYIVEIPVFRMSKHLTASYPALFTRLKGILLGHLSTNVQESLLLFFFFYVYSLYFPQSCPIIFFFLQKMLNLLMSAFPDFDAVAPHFLTKFNEKLRGIRFKQRNSSHQLK